MEDQGIDYNIVTIHCLIHQKALRTNVLSLKNVVVKAVNYIFFLQGLNHHQFCQLLKEADN